MREENYWTLVISEPIFQLHRSGDIFHYLLDDANILGCYFEMLVVTGKYFHLLMFNIFLINYFQK